MSSLRHLNLSVCKSITSLPDGLGNMSSLRHLNLSYCCLITSLPEGLGSMSSLRHLNLSGCSKLSKMPVGIGKLTGLETLNWFVVGNWLSDGDNGGGGASISELQGLNQLRGKLEIHGLENVRNGENAKEANLSSKTHLSGLKLRWSGWGENVNGNSKLQWSGWEEDVNDNNKEVLEGLLWLPLNNNITSLEIFGYKAAYFSEVFLQNLKSLKSLEIICCNELVSLPEGLLQKLTSLEKLVIYKCKRLKSLGCTWTQGDSNPNTSSSASSSSHFHSSSLQVLSIGWCGGLQFSEEDFQNLDALRSLRLIGLNQLTALPQGIEHLPMLRQLEIRICKNFRILPAWVKRREKEKYWDFICDSCNWQNIEFGLEEDANEPATEELNANMQLLSLFPGNPNIECLRLLSLLPNNPNIESTPDEASESLSLDLTLSSCYLNNDENTIVEPAREAISNNSNIESLSPYEANEPATEELNANMQLLSLLLDNPNIESAPDEANEPTTEETTKQVNNDENTIVELDGSATEPISDNPNIESAPDEEANEPATEELNANMQLDEPATEAIEEEMYTKHIASLVSPTVARHILLVFVIFLLPTTCY